MKRGLVAAAFMVAFAHSACAQMADDLGRAEWYRPPRLTVMMGFTNGPQHQRFTVRTWSSEIGARFDAEPVAGRAFLAAASEADLGAKAPLLEELWNAAIGQPSYRVLDHPERCTGRLRKLPGKTILHVIDTPTAQEGPMNRYRPLYTKLALNAKIFSFTRATVRPDRRVLGVLPDGDWLVNKTFPDRELTISLE